MLSGSRRLAAILMVVAVVLANVAFLGLGSVFNYPDILQESASKILAEFREALTIYRQTAFCKVTGLQ